MLSLIVAGPSVDTVLSVVASIVVAAAINYLVSSKSAAKFEGATGATLLEHGEAIKELKTSRSEMWNKINTQTAEIATMGARCDARHIARSHRV